MSSIHYKFKSILHYKTLQFEGLHISVDELKKVICEKENIKSESFDLIFTNAHTKRVYNTDDYVPRNCSVAVTRIPRENAVKLPKVQDTSTSGIVSRGSSTQDNSIGYIYTSDFEKLSEEQRLAHVKEVSYQKYQPSNYNRKGTAIMAGPPPPTYICNKCYQHGHWLKNCPLQSARRTTGIPIEELMETTKDDPRALLHPSGKFVVPIMHYQARQQRKQEQLPGVGAADDGAADGGANDLLNAVPPELACPLCKNLLREAVLTTCCGDSFCAECIQQRVLEDQRQQCPNSECHERITANSLVPNNKMRQAVQKFLSNSGVSQMSMPAGANKPDFNNANSLLHKLLPDLANSDQKANNSSFSAEVGSPFHNAQDHVSNSPLPHLEAPPNMVAAQTFNITPQQTNSAVVASSVGGATSSPLSFAFPLPNLSVPPPNFPSLHPSHALQQQHMQPLKQLSSTTTINTAANDTALETSLTTSTTMTIPDATVAAIFDSNEQKITDTPLQQNDSVNQKQHTPLPDQHSTKSGEDVPAPGESSSSSSSRSYSSRSESPLRNGDGFADNTSALNLAWESLLKRSDKNGEVSSITNFTFLQDSSESTIQRKREPKQNDVFSSRKASTLLREKRHDVHNSSREKYHRRSERDESVARDRTEYHDRKRRVPLSPHHRDSSSTRKHRRHNSSDRNRSPRRSSDFLRHDDYAKRTDHAKRDDYSRRDEIGKRDDVDKQNSSARRDSAIKPDNNVKQEDIVMHDTRVKQEDSVKHDDSVKLDDVTVIDESMKVDESLKMDDDTKMEDSELKALDTTMEDDEDEIERIIRETRQIKEKKNKKDKSNVDSERPQHSKKNKKKKEEKSHEEGDDHQLKKEKKKKKKKKHEKNKDKNGKSKEEKRSEKSKEERKSERKKEEKGEAKTKEEKKKQETKDERANDEKIKEPKTKPEKINELKTKDEKVKELKTKDENVRELKTKDEKVREHKLKEEKAREPRMKDEKKERKTKDEKKDGRGKEKASKKDEKKRKREKKKTVSH